MFRPRSLLPLEPPTADASAVIPLQHGNQPSSLKTRFSLGRGCLCLTLAASCDAPAHMVGDTHAL